jgi:hypothetical protein
MSISEIAEVIDTKLVTKGGAIEATVEAVPDSKASDPNGEFTLRLATPDKDREGDELMPHEWKLPLPDYISIDTDHAMTTEKTIGGGTPKLLADGTIEVPCTYAGTEHAQNTRKLLTGKHVRGASATYLQRTLKLKDGRKIVQRELLNGTVTPIPANTRAVVLASKSLSEADAAGMAQSIHDAATKLGAMCTPAAVDTEDEENDEAAIATTSKRVSLTIVTKAIKGSVEELTDRVRRAVRDAHPNSYPFIRATFLESPGKGTVVYENDNGQTLARGFTDDGTVTTVEEQPRPVTLQTAVLEHDADEPADMETKAFDGAHLTLVDGELRLKAAGDKKPHGNVPYADPGYQDDGQKRYPIDTAEHVRSAWSYINQAGNAAKYSAENLAKVKNRIRAAAKKFGIEIADSGKKSLNAPLERAIEILVAGGMTREAACKHLDLDPTGATLVSSEDAAAVHTKAASAAAPDGAAADAATGSDTAAAPLDMRARALILQLDDAAG